MSYPLILNIYTVLRYQVLIETTEKEETQNGSPKR